jgi:hypothetical protein
VFRAEEGGALANGFDEFDQIVLGPFFDARQRKRLSGRVPFPPM